MSRLRDWVEAVLTAQRGWSLRERLTPAGGGSWPAWRATLRDGQRIFCKAGEGAVASAFAAEADALRLIARADRARVVVPEVYAVVKEADRALLVLEWIDIRPGPSVDAVADGLAAIADVRVDTFGWPSGSVLGRCTLPGFEADCAIDAIIQGRVLPLLEQARMATRWRGCVTRIHRRLAERQDLWGKPAMSHGDFWGGNHGADPRGRLVVFDPAPMRAGLYWDLGFLRAFSPSLADRVRQVLARRYGYDVAGALVLERLAELVVLLAHAAMFSGGYVARCETILDELDR